MNAVNYANLENYLLIECSNLTTQLCDGSLESRVSAIEGLPHLFLVQDECIVIILRLMPGLIPLLMDIIRGEDTDEIKIQTLKIIRELAADFMLDIGFRYENSILMAKPELGLLEMLVNVISNHKGPMRSISLRTLVRIAIPEENKLPIAKLIIPVVVDIIRTDDDENSKNFAIWMVWKLSESLDCVEMLLETGIYGDILHLIRQSPGYPFVHLSEGNNIQFNSFMAIFSVVEHQVSHEIINMSGALQIFQPIMTYNYLYGLIASLICVRLNSGLNIPMLTNNMDNFLTLFDDTVNAENGGEGYAAGVFLIRIVMVIFVDVSMSEENRSLLAIPAMRELLIQLIEDVQEKELSCYDFVYANTDQVRAQCAAYATCALLHLSFINENNSELYSENGFLPPHLGIRQILLKYIELAKPDKYSPAHILLRRLSTT
jgi:hypothetical protein